ncbi:hypothetical protein C1I92_13120 [Jiangella anatolica]|uniref:4Fe-4S Wbl-type domain-containing protein n=1 Tax=Jiangella anatolica TaxID=2670374 RepID=A0A2W2BAR4_9ACTN|nr:hypothetical protein C1I92_13120 [Jiangella anatolica]
MQKDYEGAYKFKKRKFCSPECHQSHRTKPQTKVCEECKATIFRNKMNAADWAARRFCSKKCRFAKGPRPEDEKVCTLCGASYSRGRRSIVDFTAQKYCGQSCAAIALRKEDPPPLAGPHVKYDINTPPPCFLNVDFFEHETRLKQSIQYNKAGPAREAKISTQMDEIRDRWCLNCPILSECEVWAKEEGYSGIAGGHWFAEGEAQ